MLQNRVFGLFQDLNEHFLRQSLQGADHRKSAEKFRNHPVFAQVFNGDFTENIRVLIMCILQVGGKTDGRLFVQALLDDVFQIRESTAANKKNITGVHGCQRHHGILGVRSDRNLDIRSFEQF